MFYFDCSNVKLLSGHFSQLLLWFVFDHEKVCCNVIRPMMRESDPLAEISF